MFCTNQGACALESTEGPESKHQKKRSLCLDKISSLCLPCSPEWNRDHPHSEGRESMTCMPYRHEAIADAVILCSILQTCTPSPYLPPLFPVCSSVSTVWLSSPLRFLSPDFHAIFHLEPQFRADDGPQVTSPLTAPAQMHQVVGQASPALFVLRPSSFSRKMVKQWIARVTSFSWESPALLLMRKHLNHATDLAWEELEGKKVKVGVFPRKAFPNGLKFWQTMNRKLLRRAVMISDEYHLSSNEKVIALKDAGFWLRK